MGYRSEVAITMRKDDYDALMWQASDLVKELIKYGEVKDKGNVVILYWDEVKWYEEYDDVAFIMDFLDNLRENDKPFSFIRLGEDPTDIEERFFFGENGDYFDCDIVHICRYIEIEE